MSVPVIAFFNNKGGVGKTSLVYHLSWMLAELGRPVLACDLDPQANLTAAFLDDDTLAELFDDRSDQPNTIYRCLQPLTEVGDIREPEVRAITQELSLLPGDLALAGFEDPLSGQWSDSMGSQNLYRPFRMLTAFWQVAQSAARDRGAEFVLIDVGPNLGAINRSALIAADFVVVPVGADLFSLQGLSSLGPTLRRWRDEWAKRLQNWEKPAFELPPGGMWPIGYIVQQHGVRLSRPVKAYDRWVRQIPGKYRSSILGEGDPPRDLPVDGDPNCLATLKHHRSLLPLGQEARKPIFRLAVADGAIGSHAQAVTDARDDFEVLVKRVLARLRGAEKTALA